MVLLFLDLENSLELPDEKETFLKYDSLRKKENAAVIITIHPISDEKILNRELSGRWTEK